ncbi:lysozyme inhibitor LprI family protein [Ensifer sp. MJa1]|uniref:lysozyme inhibitor LprI family protein n=1 Tax=Ensifer sp. MJa1 TaxID=2919888 RepID=UPI003009C182
MRLAYLMFATFAGLAGFMPPAMAADCADAIDQATMNECADKALRVSDAELNSLYKQMALRLKDDQDAAKLLVSAQKAWIAFRDAECSFSASGVDGGSAYPMVLVQCRDGLTRKRVADFKAYLACPEGDLSCPLPPGN